MQELDSGAIVIDGVNIAKMGVEQLRANMAIIPQARTQQGLQTCREGGRGLMKAMRSLAQPLEMRAPLWLLSNVQGDVQAVVLRAS